MASTIIAGITAYALAPNLAKAQDAAPVATAPASGQSAGPAFGPSSPATPLPNTDASGKSTQVQEVVVTGSRIPQANLTSISPVTAVTSEEFKLEGTERVEDLISSLPQAEAAQSGQVGSGATGIASINLRNLGVQRTLVLVNGRRLGPGDPQAISGEAADVNIIPAALVDRVEVLTGGASATYGSDAVAGVVNFILQKNFQGVRFDVTGGGYLSENNTKSIQGLESASGDAFPSNTRLDGGNLDVSFLAGANTSDGKGNVTAYLGYRYQQVITEGQRDYSACQLQETSTFFQCGGSGTSAAAHIIAFNPTNFNQIGPGDGYVVADGAGNVRPFGATDEFNYAPYNLYERPDQRYTGGEFSHYEVNPMVDLYSEFMFSDDQTNYQSAPSGVFGQSFTLPCNSPLLSASETASFCTAGGLAPTDSVLLALLKRNTEGGPRESNFTHTDYKITIGSRGDLGSGWRYDSYLQYYSASYQQNYFTDFSLRKVGNALNVVTNPDGSVGCAVTATPDEGANEQCTPYDPFRLGGITQAALGYVQENGIQTGRTTEQIASFSLTGELGQYGVKSPFANDGVGVAFGTEYRRDNLVRNGDEAFTSGDFAGLSISPNAAGSEDLYELYTELQAPVVQDRPFAKAITLNAGYRFSDYNIGARTNTYKFGGDWSVTSDVLVRASYNHAVRVPNVIELFTPDTVGLDGSTDPCAGPTPEFSAAICARGNPGLTPGQYGNTSAASANQYNGETGGNTTLKPETSNTLTYGVVITPSIVPHLSISVDYYDITVHDIIGPVGADTILDACYEQDQFCNNIHRAPTGSLYLGNNGYVIDNDVNSGYLETKGIDVAADYRYNLPQDIGRVAFNLVGTYTSTFVDEPVVGLGHYDCAGRYGTVCGQPQPRWRHKLRATYIASKLPIEISGQWRFYGPNKVETESPNSFLAGTVYPSDSSISAQSYLDLTVTYKLEDRYTFRAGVNNVLNNNPPLIGSNVGGNVVGYTGNTYAAVYDPLGRELFASITADF